MHYAHILLRTDLLRPGPWSWKDFQSDESQKILTAPTPACSPIVTVCATNMHKHHTWQFSRFTFQQEMIMAIQEGCSTLTFIPTLRVTPGQQRHSGLSRNLH